MRTALFLALLGMLPMAGADPIRNPEAKLRDVARLQGVRGNQLLGYGMVVGLDGTGDKDQTKFTVQSLANLMARQGVSIDATAVKVKNVAAVMVTAELPAFAKPGQKIDVNVSSMGDAKSLAGGTLLMTPLQGPDGQVYAVAQGAMLVGGFSAGGAGSTVTKNHPTAGRIPDGAMVERAVPGEFGVRDQLRYSLQEEDFTTAVRVAAAVNEELGRMAARPLDGRTVEVVVPPEFQGKVVELVARLEHLPIPLQTRNRVVVNEKTGTVILGADVKLGAVAIVQGGLSISVTTTPAVSQPAPLSQGRTQATAQTQTTVTEEKPKTLSLEPGVSVGRLTEMLNTLGVSPRDLVAILQAIKDAGALNAELRIL